MLNSLQVLDYVLAGTSLLVSGWILLRESSTDDASSDG